MGDGEQISLLAVYDRLAALDSKVGALIARVDERLDQGGQQLGDHEKRLRQLEQARWKAAGAYALVSVMTSGLVASVIVWALSKH